MKFQGDILNFCDFIQVFVFTSNHHLNGEVLNHNYFYFQVMYLYQILGQVFVIMKVFFLFSQYFFLLLRVSLPGQTSQEI